uniref:Uncharacterized protein n=1 Tax=Fundulus heteroclitus TaxID=8078 RepID=A0A3Q2P0V3_FUNHE
MAQTPEVLSCPQLSPEGLNGLQSSPKVISSPQSTPCGRVTQTFLNNHVTFPCGFSAEPVGASCKLGPLWPSKEESRRYVVLSAAG